MVDAASSEQCESAHMKWGLAVWCLTYYCIYCALPENYRTHLNRWSIVVLGMGLCLYEAELNAFMCSVPYPKFVQARVAHWTQAASK